MGPGIHNNVKNIMVPGIHDKVKNIMVPGIHNKVKNIMVPGIHNKVKVQYFFLKLVFNIARKDYMTDWLQERGGDCFGSFV